MKTKNALKIPGFPNFFTQVFSTFFYFLLYSTVLFVLSTRGQLYPQLHSCKKISLGNSANFLSTLVYSKVILDQEICQVRWRGYCFRLYYATRCMITGSYSQHQEFSFEILSHYIIIIKLPSRLLST
jgi:hypothetical protein